jgi:hypothetical protein
MVRNNRNRSKHFRMENDLTPTKWSPWGADKSFLVIKWDNSGCGQKLPRRNPKTHPQEEFPESSLEKQLHRECRDTEDSEIDAAPLKSRYDSRRASLEKRQHAFGKRNHQNHSVGVTSQLECHELNGMLRPDEPNPLRHRLLTNKPGTWYKKKKSPTPQPWCRGERIHKSVRKVRMSHKDKARWQDEDYVGKKSRDLASTRHREDRRLF